MRPGISSRLFQGIRNYHTRTNIMDSFVYNANPGRVVFGSGTLKQLPEEVSRLNLTAPLLLSTPQQISQAEQLKEILNGKIAGIFTEATMHTPTDITEKALQYAKETKADAVVSIGGGSTIGLGKAISIRTGLPHICIPTTYAGSEMTPILGETADGVKKTRSDPKILPGTVIYDVDLTMTLPAAMSATSGVNAIAHAGQCFFSWQFHVRLFTDKRYSGSTLCTQYEPYHQPPCPRRHESPGILPPGNSGEPLFTLSTLSGFVWSMAMRYLSRQRRNVHSPQTLPHARRQLQSPTRRNTYRRASARHLIQCASHSGGNEEIGRGPARE